MKPGSRTAVLYNEDGSLTMDGLYFERVLRLHLANALDSLTEEGWDIASAWVHSLINRVTNEAMKGAYEAKIKLREAELVAQAKAEREARERATKEKEEAKRLLVVNRQELAREVKLLGDFAPIRVKMSLVKDYLRLIEQEEKAQAEEKRKQELQRAKEHEDRTLRDVAELRKKNLTAIGECYGD